MNLERVDWVYFNENFPKACRLMGEWASKHNIAYGGLAYEDSEKVKKSAFTLGSVRYLFDFLDSQGLSVAILPIGWEKGLYWDYEIKKREKGCFTILTSEGDNKGFVERREAEYAAFAHALRELEKTLETKGGETE